MFISFVSARVRRGSTALLVVGALTACNNKPETAGRQPLDGGAGDVVAAPATASGPKLPLAAMTALDEGNTAYRAKLYDEAIAKYRAAAAVAPEHAAPWFGLYMAASETKNQALADSAMAKVKALSADPASLTAHAEVASPSAIPMTPSMPQGHPSTTDPVPATSPSAGALPPGHPTPKASVKAPEPAKRTRM